jgi:hypothetical protein
MTEDIQQVFEGYINSIDNTTGLATVTLIDCTVERDFEEMAEIDFATVNTNFRDVEPGHVFKWRIGSRLNDQNQVVEAINEFVFEKYTEAELDEIKKAQHEAGFLADRIADGSVRWD